MVTRGGMGCGDVIVLLKILLPYIMRVPLRYDFFTVNLKENSKTSFFCKFSSPLTFIAGGADHLKKRNFRIYHILNINSF